MTTTTKEVQTVNLQDLVPLATVVEEIDSVREGWLSEAATDQAAIDALGRVAELREGKRMEGLRQSYELKQDIEALASERDRILLAVLDRGVALPAGTRASKLVGDVARAPRIKLGTVRAMADALGMVVFPMDYAADAVWSWPDSSGRDQWILTKERHGFVNAFPQKQKNPRQWGYEHYMLAPLEAYDVRKHVAHAKDLEIYAGSPVAQAFLAVTMMVPVLRTMWGEVREQRERLDRAETEIKGVARRLAELQSQVERQRAAELLQQRARAKAERQRLEEAVAVKWWLPRDPMMLAIPHFAGSISEGEGYAYIGPCWGPDFDAVVAVALGYPPVAGQRAMLRKHTEAWASYR
jgi:hypothetical protein